MGERRHALERGVSDLGGHVVVAAALVLQPCLGEFRRGLEEALEAEIEVEAPSGLMRFHEPNMTVDVERDEADCRSAVLRLIKKLRARIGWRAANHVISDEGPRLRKADKRSE